MTISLAVLRRMRDLGCTAEQIVGVLEADLEERVRRRCVRAVELALFPKPILHRVVEATPAPVAVLAADPVPKMNNAAMRDDGPADEPPGMAQTLARARNAVVLAAELTAVESRVAGGILSHFNRRHGRCDPGLETLGRDANVSERTARRAVKRLGELGLFTIDKHGGARHANAYRPAWGRLLALQPVERPAGHSFAAKMNNAAKSSVAAAQSGQIDATNRATGDPETYESNLRQRVRGLGTQRAGGRPDPSQPQLFLPIAGGRSKADSAYGAASARLWQGQLMPLVKRLGAAPGEALMAKLTAEIELAAVTAERRLKGSGLEVLLELVDAASAEQGLGKEGTG